MWKVIRKGPAERSYLTFLPPSFLSLTPFSTSFPSLPPFPPSLPPSQGSNPSDEAFKFRRGHYFWHTRAAIGHATVLAVARRARVAEHTLHRTRAGGAGGVVPTPKTTSCTRLRLRWQSE